MRYEYVVVGGGVYGCAVAWGLAKRGSSVALYEKRSIASGASGGPGKRGVRANGRDPRELPLARRAYDIWPDLSDNLSGETGYERRGSLRLTECSDRDGDEMLLRLEAQRTVQEAAGVPTTLVSHEEILELQPGMNSRVEYGLHCLLDGTADHTATTRSFADAACRQGAEVVEGDAVTRVVARPGLTNHVYTSAGVEVQATRGVVITGNWFASDLLRDSFGLGLPIWRIAPQMSFVEPPDGFTLNSLVGHVARPLAVKQLSDGTVMLSGGRTVRWDPTAETGSPTAEVLTANLADAVAVLPDLDGATQVRLDASRVESCVVDGVPVIDAVPDTTVIYATGWSGHGFAISPAVAECLVEWAVSGERPIPLRPFAVSRFPGLGH